MFNKYFFQILLKSYKNHQAIWLYKIWDTIDANASVNTLDNLLRMQHNDDT